MRFNKLDLNQLVVLDALLDECSVTKAAKRLFLSQSATSCAMARLREYFEDELLVQIGKAMVLTPRAESLRHPVREVLLQIQSITNDNPAFDPVSSDRKIVVETSDYVTSVFLGEVLRRASIEAPRMTFRVRTAATLGVVHLENGEIDLLITPDFRAGSTQPVELLFEDSWSCVVCADNDRIGETLTLAEYLDAGHVIMEWAGGAIVTSDSRAAAALGYNRQAEVTVETFNVVPHFLIGTRRIATLQTRLASLLQRYSPSLRVLPCPYPIPKLVEVVQYNKFQERDPALMWFRQLMREVAQASSVQVPVALSGAGSGTA
ncbi:MULTISPECIES: LysR family transcriptional regulator [Paraburkholderia]|uniref:LysR family transcriptional regulator n=1 Tax=Paraburkholderia TaxID=1822464 RepID=UPI00224CC45E|nr:MULTISPECIES: LysR family transcriptional regulator [Paraburkholderia]MCX4161742.1 LysR family transcriptional regulator [Paraburkholderia megapolitana]MDN7157239.1 LysR family transcriptional regulator [Paraburkholderia sp. CHISQ3]MDQ6494284.1 LysR family transcriptional regulator [Paraburkholderia megapolitana]